MSKFIEILDSYHEEIQLVKLDKIIGLRQLKDDLYYVMVEGGWTIRVSSKDYAIIFDFLTKENS